MYNFLDKIAENIYWEKRRELEKALGLVHDVALFKGRYRTKDAAGVAFPYRMGAGWPGDVNRTHPASIEPCKIDASAPPTAYGQAVLGDVTTQGVRPFAAGDSTTATDLYGVTVRPFPMQQQSVNPGFGTGVPPTSGIIDVLKWGYITSVLGDGTLTGATKFGTVYVQTGITTGHVVVGGFQAATTGTVCTMAAANASFNGVQDANGFVELIIHQG